MGPHLFVGVEGRAAVTEQQQDGRGVGRQTGQGQGRHEAEQRVLWDTNTPLKSGLLTQAHITHIHTYKHII